jgi:hypothetical protein
MTAIRTRGPWEIPDALYFYAGRFSMFARVDGLHLPAGWYGHPTPAPLYPVRGGEWFLHACKAQNQLDFEWVLAANSARQAKQRGGPNGERQPNGTIRKLALRPDWDIDITVAGLTGPTKLHVAIYCLRQRAQVDRAYAQVLALTGDRVLVEDSPYDFEWGGRDKAGGFTGRNLLGIAHMVVRAELPAVPETSQSWPLLQRAGLSSVTKRLKGRGGTAPGQDLLLREHDAAFTAPASGGAISAALAAIRGEHPDRSALVGRPS